MLTSFGEQEKVMNRSPNEAVLILAAGGVAAVSTEWFEQSPPWIVGVFLGVATIKQVSQIGLLWFHAVMDELWRWWRCAGMEGRDQD